MTGPSLGILTVLLCCSDLHKTQHTSPTVCFQFASLLRVVRDFTSSRCATSRVRNLTDRLVTALEDVSSATLVLQETAAWQRTSKKLMEKIAAEFPLYTDLTTPFLCGIAQVRYT